MTPARCMVTTVAQQAVDAWRAVLAYGIERRELARNVAAAMKKVPRVHQEMSTYTPTRSAGCCAPPTRTETGTSGI
jgi:hypothetical protein